jgi:hypothetical protein
MGGTPMGRGRRSIIRGTLGVHNRPRRSRWLFARPRQRASTRGTDRCVSILWSLLA